MKKNLLFKIGVVAAMVPLFVGLNSNSGGYTNGATTCGGGGCHGAGATTAVLGGVIGSYTPGTTYTLFPTVGSTTKAAAGYNLAVDKGTLALIAGNTASKLNSAKTQATHTSPLSLVSGVGLFSVTWTAPAAGSGTVTFKIIGNAVNLANGPGGDEWAVGPNVTLTEAAPSAIESKKMASLQIVHTSNGIRLNDASALKDIRIFGLNGNVVKSISQVGNSIDINTSDINPGYYILSAIQNGKVISTKFFAH
jgi:hypothetical protein